MGLSSAAAPDRALFRAWPALSDKLGWAQLGTFPTPVQPLTVARELGFEAGRLYVKRDDLSAREYGGNKVRTLESLFGAARRHGARRIHSTGAFGSNHALATVLHAKRADLEAGVILFPQPYSWAALENLVRTVSHAAVVRALPHWATLPFGMWRTRRSDERAEVRSSIMVPGGATPLGALGYVSAALELLEQVARGELPRPGTIMVGVGSTCTSAGLLVGLACADRLGIGRLRETDRPVRLVSVSVTPWPITSRWNVLRLAERTARLLAELTAEPALGFGVRELGARFQVDGRYLGDGYGRPTDNGRAAMARWREHVGFALDSTYTAKVVAALLETSSDTAEPVVYWSTKSTAPLPVIRREAVLAAPPGIARWVAAAERELFDIGDLPPDWEVLSDER
jgi:D-cysteine desulfhydrase